MYFGEIEIPDWRIDALCISLGAMFLRDMKDPEIRARVMAKAEELRREEKEKACQQGRK